MLYVKRLITGGGGMLSPKSIDSDGETTGISYSNTDDVNVKNTGSEINIAFSLPYVANVKVSILDLSGIEIKPIVNNVFAAGEYLYTAQMDNPGTYLVRVEINGNINIKKVIIK